MSSAENPDDAHIPLTDGSALDVLLNGERMEFRDAYDEAIALQRRPFKDGVLVVTVGWGHGVTIEAAHLDADERDEKAVIPCEFEAERDDGDAKLFLADDERYAFEIELVRIHPDEPEVATDGGFDTQTLRVGPARTVAYGPAGAPNEEWALRFTTEGAERVAVRLDEDAMYQLWTEVHNVPWPRDGTEQADLRREVAAQAEGAGVETLRDALDVLRGER